MPEIIDGKGYRLPEIRTVEDYKCLIVYYPDRPEYRQALFGSLFYLGTWTAWERDSVHGGKVAAAAWKNANDLTLECDNMSCFDELIAAVKSLELQVTLNCFCEYVSLENSPTPPGIVIGAGPVPTVYAGEELPEGTTWDDYTALVCGAAHAYVDYVKGKNEELMGYMGLGLLALGIVAGILALVSGFGLAVLIVLGNAATIFAALVAAPGAGVFVTVTQEIEDARNEITDAITCGGSLRAVMETAINGPAWELFYQWVNWEAAQAIVQSGEYDGQFIGFPEPNENCACDNIHYLYYDFDSGDVTQWAKTNTHWFSFGGEVGGVIRAQTNHVSQNFLTSMTAANLRAQMGLAAGTPIELLSFQARFINGSSFDITSNRVQLRATTGTSGLVFEEFVLHGANDVIQADFYPDEPVLISTNGIAVWFEPNLGGLSKFVHVDNIALTFRSL